MDHQTLYRKVRGEKIYGRDLGVASHLEKKEIECMTEQMNKYAKGLSEYQGSPVCHIELVKIKEIHSCQGPGIIYELFIDNWVELLGGVQSYVYF